MRNRLLAGGLVALGAVAAAAPIAAGSSKPVKNVKVVDYAFKPSKLTIKKGTEIKWTWGRDFSPHNVTLVKGPKGIVKRKWRSKTASRGVTFERTFSKLGTYHFLCTIHPYMTMTVVVKQ